MKRIVTEVRVGEGKMRHRTRIEDEPVSKEEWIRRQYYFLRELAEQQDLLSCGYGRFERLTIWWDGNRWVAEAEALLDEV